MSSIFKNYIVLLFVVLVSCIGDSSLPQTIEEAKVTLEDMYVSDQTLRHEVSEIRQEQGHDSPLIKEKWEEIKKIDSSNVIVVCHILDTFGWLGKKEIGYKANRALFLVIQHANNDVQETYLPMLREAVEDKNALGADLALLEDRVATNKGEAQVYGSQIGIVPSTGEYYVFPLVDPEHVDERRLSLGLDSIESYLSFFGMVWDVEEYKRQLPRWEREHKAMLENMERE